MPHHETQGYHRGDRGADRHAGSANGSGDDRAPPLRPALQVKQVGKKQRLDVLRGQLAVAEREFAAERPKVCFGGRRLLRGVPSTTGARGVEVEPRALSDASVQGLGEIGKTRASVGGLPYQTVSSVIATVQQALRIEPDRAAVFGYAHVPWMKEHQVLLQEDALPGPAVRFAQSNAAEDVLRRQATSPLCLDHCLRTRDSLAIAANDGQLRRN
jgi:hypothetical protein